MFYLLKFIHSWLWSSADRGLTIGAAMEVCTSMWYREILDSNTGSFEKKTVHVLDVQGVNKIFLNPRCLSSKIEICKKVQYFVQCDLKWPKNISESSPKVFV